MDGSLPQYPAEEPPDDAPAPRPGPSRLSFLIAAVLIIGGGYFLATKLRAESRLEDCLMSGRTNCAPIEVPSANASH